MYPLSRPTEGGNLTDSPTLATALVAAQADMPALQRDAINPAFKRGGKESKYLSLESLLAEVLPVLNRHGLAVSQWPTFVVVGTELHPALETALVHGPSGDTWKGTMLLLPSKRDAQGQGAAITYAKRYALMSICGLSADEDDDGNAASNVKSKRPAKPEGVISDAQLKRLHTIVGSVGLSPDAAKEIIKAIGGVVSSKDIPRANYDAVIAALEAARVVAA